MTVPPLTFRKSSRLGNANAQLNLYRRLIMKL